MSVANPLPLPINAPLKRTREREAISILAASTLAFTVCLGADSAP